MTIKSTIKALTEKFAAHRADVAQAQRDVHQKQEHLTDADMAKPDAMKTYAAFKR